jgi:WS/DGAT/MGAT family acyltransferase
MASTHAERVKPAQSVALTLEDLGLGMHSGILALFGDEPLGPEETLDVPRIEGLIERALCRIPHGRQRVRRIPVEGQWVWTDDERFNLQYHVRHTALPRPGDERQLKRLAGRLMSERLDRNRPLWEAWVIEGVANARFALVLKLHAGVLEDSSVGELLAALGELDAEAELPAAPAWRPRPSPATAGLLLDAAAYWGRKPREVLEQTRETLVHPIDALRSSAQAPAAWRELLREALAEAPRTALNPRRIGGHRRVDTLELDAHECEQIARALAVPLGDVALALLAGGLESFLRARGDKLEAAEIATFLSLPPELGGGSEAATPLRVALPVRIGDPIARVIEIGRARLAAETDERAAAHELRDRLESWIPARIQRATQAIGRRARRSGANLSVELLAAPAELPTLLGAPARSIALFAPLRSDQGLSVGIVRSASHVSFGFNSDWDLFPDLHQLVEATAGCFAQLRAYAERGARERRPQ